MAYLTPLNFDFEDCDMNSKRRPGIIERVDMRMNLDKQSPKKDLEKQAPPKAINNSSVSIHNVVRRKGCIERVDEAMKLANSS